MTTYDILFFKPKDWIGRVVTWVTGDPYSHSIVKIDNTIWSSEIPRVKKETWEESSFSKRPYDQISIRVSTNDVIVMEDWLDSRVGTFYNILSLVGWLLHIPQLQWRNRFYCHEFCREALEKAGILQDIDELITAEKLIQELKTLAGNIQPE